MTTATLPRGTRLFLAAALAALASTFLVPIANPDWAAYRYDHGHLTVSGAVPEHTHPWEHAHGEAEDHAPIVYTEGGNGAVPGVGALLAPATAVSLSARVVEIDAAASDGWAVLAHADAPGTPPPQA